GEPPAEQLATALAAPHPRQPVVDQGHSEGIAASAGGFARDSEGGFAPLPTLVARLRLAPHCLPPEPGLRGRSPRSDIIILTDSGRPSPCEESIGRCGRFFPRRRVSRAPGRGRNGC